MPHMPVSNLISNLNVSSGYSYFMDGTKTLLGYNTDSSKASVSTKKKRTQNSRQENQNKRLNEYFVKQCWLKTQITDTLQSVSKSVYQSYPIKLLSSFSASTLSYLLISDENIQIPIISCNFRDPILFSIYHILVNLLKSLSDTIPTINSISNIHTIETELIQLYIELNALVKKARDHTAATDSSLIDSIKEILEKISVKQYELYSTESNLKKYYLQSDIDAYKHKYFPSSSLKSIIDAQSLIRNNDSDSFSFNLLDMKSWLSVNALTPKFFTSKDNSSAKAVKRQHPIKNPKADNNHFKSLNEYFVSKNYFTKTSYDILNYSSKLFTKNLLTKILSSSIFQIIYCKTLTHNEESFYSNLLKVFFSYSLYTAVFYLTNKSITSLHNLKAANTIIQTENDLNALYNQLNHTVSSINKSTIKPTNEEIKHLKSLLSEIKAKQFNYYNALHSVPSHSSKKTQS